MTDYQLLLVEAPNVPAAELKAAVRWRMKDMLDYRVDEATVDVLDIPPDPAAGGRSRFDVRGRGAQRGRPAVHRALRVGRPFPLSVIDIAETAQRNIAALFEIAGPRRCVPLPRARSRRCSPSTSAASCTSPGASTSASTDLLRRAEAAARRRARAHGCSSCSAASTTSTASSPSCASRAAARPRAARHRAGGAPRAEPRPAGRGAHLHDVIAFGDDGEPRRAGGLASCSTVLGAALRNEQGAER